MPTEPIPIHLDPRHGEMCLCGGNPDLNPEPQPECTSCLGTGKIGGDAEPVGEVHLNVDGWWWRRPSGQWRGVRVPEASERSAGLIGYSTPEAAATALRAAVLGVRIVWMEGPIDDDPGTRRWYYKLAETGTTIAADSGPFATPDLAIIAALEARRAQEDKS